MLSTYASRTILIYWWLSDYYYAERKKKRHSRPLANLAHYRSGQIAASLLSLCMTKWLRKWWRGWCYFRSNAKIAKSLVTVFGHMVIDAKPYLFLNTFKFKTLSELFQVKINNCCMILGWKSDQKQNTATQQNKPTVNKVIFQLVGLFKWKLTRHANLHICIIN